MLYVLVVEREAAMPGTIVLLRPTAAFDRRRDQSRVHVARRYTRHPAGINLHALTDYTTRVVQFSRTL